MRTASVAVLLLALASSGMCAELEIGSRPPDKKLIVEEEASLLRLYLKGGLAMHGILIASIVALAYAIERGIALRQQVQVKYYRPQVERLNWLGLLQDLLMNSNPIKSSTCQQLENWYHSTMWHTLRFNLLLTLLIY